jgi:hypothetical protein
LVTRRARQATAILTGALALGLAACGGEDRADSTEPEGTFPVEVTKASFPAKQRLAETSDLRIAVKNVGSETVPDLTATVFVDEGADGAFSTRIDQPGVANPNRPVWVLENKWPRLAGEPAPKGLSGAVTAQTNTYAFGPLEPGETAEMVWRVTPVMKGRWTVNYQVAAGTQGKARAVTEDGDDVAGDFAVKITDEPPTARVADDGSIVIER